MGKFLSLLHCQIVMWMNQNFLLDEDLSVAGNEMSMMFMCQRTKTPLVIDMSTTGEISILTESMDTAGDILQSLASFLNMEDLNVQADFPKDMTDLGEILTKVENVVSYFSLLFDWYGAMKMLPTLYLDNNDMANQVAHSSKCA